MANGLLWSLTSWKFMAQPTKISNLLKHRVWIDAYSCEISSRHLTRTHVGEELKSGMISNESEYNHGLQSSYATAPRRFIKGRAIKLVVIIVRIVMIFATPWHYTHRSATLLCINPAHTSHKNYQFRGMTLGMRTATYSSTCGTRDYVIVTTRSSAE